MMSPKLPQGRQLSPYDAEYRRCPHAILAQVRDSAPGYWDGEFDRFVLTDLDLARRMLLRPDVSAAPRSMRHRTADAEPGLFEQTILQQDPPEHGRLRGIISRALSPASLAGMRTRLAATATELLDGLGDQAGLDIHADYAMPMATRTTADLLGIERSLHPCVSRWVKDLAAVFDPLACSEAKVRLHEAQHALLECFRQRCAETASAAEAPDLVTRLVCAGKDGGDIEAVAATCVLLLGAGITTTADLITNGLRLLLTHPGQLERLRADPALMPGTVEETLRLEPPVAQFARIASRALRLDGIEVPAGAGIGVWVIAAGCDPKVHKHPLAFDISRGQHAHLAFAAGIHACPGSQLARMEASIAWHVILDRFPRLRLADTGSQRRISLVFNGWDELQVQTR